MKKYLLSKTYAFSFQRRRFFHRRTNKRATLNVSILYTVGLSLPFNSSLRCVRCVVKETAPKNLDVCETVKLRKAENSGLQDVAIFCRHCMLTLVLLASAPSGDLQFFKYLNKYKTMNEKVATAASRTLLVTFHALVKNW